MANPTFLDLKTFVANQLGNVDQASYIAKRENLINLARRKFYSEYQWSFLTVPDATVSLAAGAGPLPSDYNLKFPPIDVYTYSGSFKYRYSEVPYSDLAMYQADSYVYAVNRAARTVATNQPSAASVKMEYTKVPADRPADTSEDLLPESAPTITAIGYLAISMWWLSKERSTAKFQLFDDKYKEELGLMLKDDQLSEPPVLFMPAAPYLNKGYTGRYYG